MMADGTVVTGTHLKNKTVDIDALFSRVTGGLPKDYPPRKQPSSRYDFSHPNRGMAIVISNETFDEQSSRSYADLELKKMRTVFEKLHFEVFTFKDLTKKQLNDVLEKAAMLTRFHHQSDCFACVIGSHGNEIKPKERGNPSDKDGESPQLGVHVIYGTDKEVETNKLTQMFTDEKCPGLRGKPRLFFIQACRKSSTEAITSCIDEGVTLGITSGESLPFPSAVTFDIIEPRKRTGHNGNGDKAEGLKANEGTDGTLPSDVSESNTTATQDTDLARSVPIKRDVTDTVSTDRVAVAETNVCSETQNQATLGNCDATLEVPSMFSLSNLLKKIFDDDQVYQPSPVCRKHFMIMYSTTEGMLSYGRDEVGGFMLDSLYNIIVRNRMYVRQPTPDGLDILDTMTLVNDYGLKEFTSRFNITLEDNTAQYLTAKSAFVFEHKLVDDVIFRQKTA